MTDPVELLSGTAGDVTLTISGAIPSLPPTARGENQLARVRWAVSSSGSASSRANVAMAVETLQRGGVAAGQIGFGEPAAMKRVDATGRVAPVLFEFMTYDIYLEWAEAAAGVRLETDAPGVVRHVRTGAARGGRREAHYRLNLENDVGLLSLKLLEVTKGGSGQRAAEIARLEIEIYPRKLDYQTDYRAMLSEVARVEPALVFEAAGRTALEAGAAAAERSTPTEWYEILRAVARRLFRVVDAIHRDPQRRLEARPRLVRAERARRVRPQDLERALRLPGNLTNSPAAGALATSVRRIWERAAVPDFDAEGNRYLRWLLGRTLTQLGHLERDLRAPESPWRGTRAGNALADRWIEEIVALRPGFQRRLQYEWLADAGEHRGGALSPNLHAHPLYSEAFSIGRTLLRGLHVDAEHLTDVGSRPVSTLYEYWCFLAIVDLLRRHAAVEQTTNVQVSYGDARVSLRRGEVHGVRFRHLPSGRGIHVLYNREYDTPTIPQRPDVVVAFEGQSGVHVFDAKYRLQFDPEYVKRFGGVGPRVEDVNVMHRYRDAIVSSPAGGRLITSACVLFPWADSAGYAQHAFCQSLRAVGIGGLPFLPSSTGLVRDRLDALVRGAFDARRAHAVDSPEA